MYRLKGKRILDIVLAAMGLIASLPFFVVLPVILWVHFKRNPFFAQLRPGLHGQLFKILKFRTMYYDGQPPSRLGRMLRSSSLDEIPQFWNVLCGDMSIVGPRPLLAEYLPLYSPEQHLRHNVKPGMTGLAQINGRNDLSWEEKFDYDLQYVDNLSFSLDLRIVWATAMKMLPFINSGGSGLEAIPFKGSELC